MVRGHYCSAPNTQAVFCCVYPYGCETMHTKQSWDVYLYGTLHYVGYWRSFERRTYPTQTCYYRHPSTCHASSPPPLNWNKHEETVPTGCDPSVWIKQSYMVVHSLIQYGEGGGGALQLRPNRLYACFWIERVVGLFLARCISADDCAMFRPL